MIVEHEVPGRLHKVRSSLSGVEFSLQLLKLLKFEDTHVLHAMPSSLSDHYQILLRVALGSPFVKNSGKKRSCFIEVVQQALSKPSTHS